MSNRGKATILAGRNSGDRVLGKLQKKNLMEYHSPSTSSIAESSSSALAAAAAGFRPLKRFDGDGSVCVLSLLVENGAGRACDGWGGKVSFGGGMEAMDGVEK
ncbi:hypothetical protein Droror1_Dr00001970 [Drosera rotundifolia]